MAFTTLNLNKENFKFSSAHFLIFDEKNAEKLHGHNYRVWVSLLLPEAQSFQGFGFHVDFRVFKDSIKRELDLLDEHVILPELHPDIKTRIEGQSLHLNFRDRHYVFPENEVVLLPLVNTSVELLSQFLAQKFQAEFGKLGVIAVKVTVEETSGQGATYNTHSSAF